MLYDKASVQVARKYTQIAISIILNKWDPNKWKYISTQFNSSLAFSMLQHTDPKLSLQLHSPGFSANTTTSDWDQITATMQTLSNKTDVSVCWGRPCVLLTSQWSHYVNYKHKFKGNILRCHSVNYKYPIFVLKYSTWENVLKCSDIPWLLVCFFCKLQWAAQKTIKDHQTVGILA